MHPIPSPLWAPDYAADLREEADNPERGLGSPDSWAGLLEGIAACRLTPEALAALAAATARLEALREAAAAMDAAALALARQLEAMGPAT
jgi:hypothetical protein